MNVDPDPTTPVASVHQYVRDLRILSLHLHPEDTLLNYCNKGPN